MPDAFDILGLPPTFHLTREAIQRAYLARVRVVHPDAAKGGEHGTALLNAAKKTLDDPESRANLLLTRLGGGGASKEADRSLPDGFLLEMMDMSESLDTARAAGDAAAIARFESWAESRRVDHQRRVASLFAATPPDLRAVRRELNAWRYIERMIENLNN